MELFKDKPPEFPEIGILRAILPLLRRTMPLVNYGVLKGRPIQRRLGMTTSHHYQLQVVDDTTDYRVAINVCGDDGHQTLLYLMDEDFHHPMLSHLLRLPLGFNPLPRTPGSLALDYIRQNLFDPLKMKPLAHNIPGPDNDLNEKIDRLMQRAMAEENALIYAFGERWGPIFHHKDPIFGFSPGNGIHDVHMNQGNDPRFQGQDGPYQDGGVLINFPSNGQWIGLFLKFQPQGWHTCDRKGHRIETITPLVPGCSPEGLVRIVAALVNPIGDDTNRETVTLLNTSPHAIDLRGWKLCDRKKHAHALTDTIAPGHTLRVTLKEPVQLGNKGGLITLIDAQGLKIHGVSYTYRQADHEGWTLAF